MIKETKEAVLCIINFANAAGASLEDGKLDLTDALKFWPAIVSLKAAVEGADKIPMEFAAMNDADRDELKQYVVDNFDIPEDKIELIIEQALSAILALWSLLDHGIFSKKA